MVGNDPEAFYRVAARAKIPEDVARREFASLYSQAVRETGEPQKDYSYYADLMGKAEDKEAWLEENKFLMPYEVWEKLDALLNNVPK
jgi:hypothetical protein